MTDADRNRANYRAGMKTLQTHYPYDYGYLTGRHISEFGIMPNDSTTPAHVWGEDKIEMALDAVQCALEDGALASIIYPPTATMTDDEIDDLPAFGDGDVPPAFHSPVWSAGLALAVLQIMGST